MFSAKNIRTVFLSPAEDDTDLAVVIGEILQSYLWAKVRHMWRYTNSTYINPHVRLKGRTLGAASPAIQLCFYAPFYVLFLPKHVFGRRRVDEQTAPMST
jgi:hypothetical protein